ncbi:ATP-binding protein [Leadbettera azotonutricia]|uniref:histidine kinase n=1 Tax=Leadbettera azotonutricia (strain ATCC BAA-888 / DSM 13862 / ZAS-9) TaxID=545695 RepID=F5YBF5_LEAAZ|nr:ATP-binding protein [Leadbettera azotonutricia]AEF82881.1 two-component system sensory/regulatory protein [Leadbettera azotonutricia ZAS-9]
MEKKNKKQSPRNLAILATVLCFCGLLAVSFASHDYQSGKGLILLASFFLCIPVIGIYAMTLGSGKIVRSISTDDVTEFYAMQQELINAKEQAEYYNKAKNDFISRISHEMRTPMNGIIGMADLAKIAEDDQHRNHCLNKIGESAQDLLNIINNILDWIKFEHGNFSRAFQECSLPSMLQSLEKLIRSRAEERKQHFTMNVAGDLPDIVLADEAGLRQALINILGNAVKFTTEGGFIDFSVTADKGALHFEIRDTGIGITDELMVRLWDPFEQGNNGINRIYYGVGLGLPIAKGIIESMNGKITVESEPDKGSIFTCTIPLRIPETQGSDKAIEDQAPFENKRFLIVDDVEVNRDILGEMLEETGAIIDSAVNGRDAVEKFCEKKGAYDFLLMDLHMPEMDGFEASRRIRASGLPGATRVPIIAVTADIGGEVMAKCTEAGINDHVGKPIDFMHLIGMISRYLQKHKANILRCA